MLGHARREVGLVEVGAIGVDHAGGAGERCHDLRSLRGSGRRDEPAWRRRVAVTMRPTRSPFTRCLAASEATCSTAWSSGACPSSPAQSSTDASRASHTTSRWSRSISRTTSFPRRALAFHAIRLNASPGTCSRSSFQGVALAGDVRGAAGLDSAACSATHGRVEHHLHRERHDLDAERVREHERHFVEALTAELGPADLERHPVNAPAPDAFGAQGHLHEGAALGRQIDDLGVNVGLEHARGQHAKRYAANVVDAPIAELRLELDGSAAHGSSDALRGVPHHLEAG